MIDNSIYWSEGNPEVISQELNVPDVAFGMVMFSGPLFF